MLVLWGQGLTVLGPVQVHPRRAVTTKHRGIEFGVKCSKGPVSRMGAFSG